MELFCEFEYAAEEKALYQLTGYSRSNRLNQKWKMKGVKKV